MENITVSVFLIKTKQNKTTPSYSWVSKIYSPTTYLEGKKIFLYNNHGFWNQTDPGTNIFA